MIVLLRDAERVERGRRPAPPPAFGSDQNIEYAWWLVLFPGLAIFLTVTAFNVIGDRFRDALDPRSE